MKKTILIRGSSDGIAFQTAKRLVGEGHNIILHGQMQKKYSVYMRN